MNVGKIKLLELSKKTSNYFMLNDNILKEIDSYYSYDKYNEKLIEILNDEESQKLNISKLRQYLEKIKLLENEELIKFLKKEHVYFEMTYKKHYEDNFIEGIHGFIKFSQFNSMCQSWLMYLYH